MGHKLTADGEAKLLRDLIREAHEATQALNQAIRQARQLAPGLVAEFEQLHRTEMQLLQNHLTAEQNRASADLNQAVEDARDQICEQLTAQEMILDHRAGVMRVIFTGKRFDDQVTPPAVPLEKREISQ